MRAIDQPRCLCQRLVAGLVGIIWKTVLAWREVSSASQSRDGYFQFPGKYRVVSSKYSKIELSKNHMNTFSLSFVLSLSLSLSRMWIQAINPLECTEVESHIGADTCSSSVPSLFLHLSLRFVSSLGHATILTLTVGNLINTLLWS